MAAYDWAMWHPIIGPKNIQPTNQEPSNLSPSSEATWKPTIGPRNIVIFPSKPTQSTYGLPSQQSCTQPAKNLHVWENDQNMILGGYDISF